MDTIVLPTNVQMISVSGPTIVGQNQITAIVSPASNPNGMRLLSIYTQIIQANNPNTNIAQSLLLTAATAPVDFNSKLQCFSIWRTYQDGSQTPIALGGGTPVNDVDYVIPPGWGIWQCLNVTTTALVRNNVRLGLVIY